MAFVTARNSVFVLQGTALPKCCTRNQLLPKTTRVLCASRRRSCFAMTSNSSWHLHSRECDVEWFSEPVTISGEVQRGFGRGSRQLGTPTANLPGALLDDIAATERNGVYLGFGAVPGISKAPSKMVTSIGYNPTFDEKIDRVLEAYLMDDTLPTDFYGREMRLCIVGFLRPELKFESLDSLVANIKNDVAVASSSLDSARANEFRNFVSLL